VNPAALAIGTYNATATIADPNASSSPQTVPVTFTISSTGVSTSITSPANGATVSGTVTVTATATSTAGIASVQFYLDGSPLGSAATSSPYSISWNTASSTNASHTLYALATDNNSNTATSTSIAVTVANASAAPVIANISVSGITTDNATVGWTTNLAATTTIDYGTSVSYGSSVNDTNQTTGDSLTLSGLSANTIYHFAIIAYANGTSTASGDNTFTTAALPSSGGGEGGGGGGGSVGVAGSYGSPYLSGGGTGAPSAPQVAATTTPPAAGSAASIEAEINALTAQLHVLLAEARRGSSSATVSTSSYAFTRNLSYGTTGNDVQELQQFLISENSGPAARKLKAHGTTRNFGILTLNALKEFKKAAGIKPASGYFGPITRAYVNAL